MTYTLEDYLVGLHTGQWFGWSDSKNKTYTNIVIHSDDTKPTEQECTDGVAALQAEFDSQQYARDRAEAYPSLQDQADMAYWDRQDGTTTLDDAIAAVKDANPKP
jgi:Mlc titration factor MtfA (ptsG expression regulator)